jgi:3'-phosphoadenosine 5'-phosphosulfate (PAPS) 3'-phosphatase
MEGIKSCIEPENIDDQFIKLDFLHESLLKRADFNDYMRTAVYGPEILEKFDSFKTSNAVVWIDPLDGTSDFVKGNLSAVTVLIGLVIDGIPKISVVHHPFKTNENDG